MPYWGMSLGHVLRCSMQAQGVSEVGISTMSKTPAPWMCNSDFSLSALGRSLRFPCSWQSIIFDGGIAETEHKSSCSGLFLIYCR